MAMPSGWTRTESDPESRLGYVDYHGPCWVSVNAKAVYIHSGADLGMTTTFDRDALISILFRAFRQHAHLSAHPSGPPLPEDKEEQEIIA